MKGLHILCFYILFFLFFSVNAQQVAWAKKYVSVADQNHPKSIAFSPRGHLAVQGTFINFRATRGQGSFLYSLDTLGNVKWGDTYRILRPYNSVTSSGGLAYTSEGKLYAGVNFSDSLVVDGTTIPVSGNENFLLLRYAPNGLKESMQVHQRAQLHDIFIDDGDNVLLLLSFTSKLILYGQTFFARGQRDLLLLRINSSGKLTLSRQLHGNVSGNKIKVSANGNLFIMGSFRDTLYFGGQAFAGSHSSGDDDFVIKLSSMGGFLYYLPMYKQEQQASADMAVDHNDRLVATGINCWSDGCYGMIDTYDAEGGGMAAMQVNGLTFGSGYFPQNVAICDPAGFWVLTQEHNTGDYGDPNDDWTNMGLTKYGFEGDQLARDTFMCDGDPYSADMIGDANGNLYITGVLQPQSKASWGSFALHNTEANSTFYIVKFKTQGIATGIVNEDRLGSRLNVFPNPAHNVFNLQYTSRGKDKVSVTVRNLLGEVILAKAGEIEQGTFTEKIDLSGQPSGVYFVEMRGEEHRQVKRVVLE